LKIWANYLKMQAKIAPNVVWFWKIGAQRVQKHKNTFFWKSSQKKVFKICVGGNIRAKSYPKTFLESLGKFGQTLFAPPKICRLLHLCIQPSTASIQHMQNVFN